MSRKLVLQGMIAFLIMFFSFFIGNQAVLAAESDTINVTLPSNISILFNEEGSNNISDFQVDNQSLVPITINSINVTECNNWQLVPKGSLIPANTKQLVFELENYCLQNGQNETSIQILEQTKKALSIQVERGAWSNSESSAKALDLEFEYLFGTKEFQISFDTNWSGHTISPMTACNDETVILPTIVRPGYELLGWQDSEGTLYNMVYIMPIGDITLTAKWAKANAYAIYFAEDNSFRFVRSVDPIYEGDTYNEKTVTAVYTGFEEAVYTKYSDTPWYSNAKKITNVVVEDEISPVSTAYWFLGFENCESLDLSKLNTENVVSMDLMFSLVGYTAESVTFTGLEDWDVSSVTSMASMFNGVGFTYANTVSIGDLGAWEVSNVEVTKNMFSSTAKNASTFELYGLEYWDTYSVTNMFSMFSDAGIYSDWSLDCSAWDVSNVTRYDLFNHVSEAGVATKVIAPAWAN